jgi:MFS family permease
MNDLQGLRSDDPRETLAASPMSGAQIVAVAITVGLNALDGYDVLAISFAAPGIARQWGLDRAALGIVLSMELIGMGVGSIVLGGLADRLGRRRLLLGCLGLMVLGLVMATQSSTIVELSTWRVLTGLGIGGMLASINAVAAEFSNRRRRSLNVSIMAIGYPIGAVLGGTVAAMLLKQYSWHSVFWFGAGVTALFIPLVFWLVPESIEWLCQIQPPGALARINRSWQRMGHAVIERLPAVNGRGVGTAGPGVLAGAGAAAPGIFGQTFRRTTILTALAYFLHVTSFYFVVKWVPKIVVDMGYTAAAAAGVLVWVNIGGATGGATLGLLSLRWPVKYLTMAVLVMSTVMLAVFGAAGGADISRLKAICAVTGFFTNAGIVGLYGVLAQGFPARLRATGTGFAVGFGRAGSVLAPIVAGFLFNAGYGLEFVSLAMGVGSVAAAVAVGFLKISGREVLP